MNTSDDLIICVKQWVSLEKEIKDLKNKIKALNVKKKQSSQDLITIMKKNQVDCFDISEGQIIYKQNKVKKAINGKFLLKSLKDYFKSDQAVADELTNYILNNREINIKESINLKPT